MPLAPGDRLGPYEILSRIGAGGMGEVWKANDTRLAREVAIKTSSEQFTDRFESEARAVAALNHANICHLYDVGPDYLVMEYIEGKPLEGPQPLAKALDYAAQILDALDAAHRKGITHRDLKPANILVTKQGIKLLDFGLAKQSAPLKDTDLTQALTQRGHIVGTLSYMSPEQLQSRDVDARSDIFSFGLVFYELLTGKRAFDGESAASVIAGILEREPPSLAEVVPPAVDRVLRLCLAKDPDQRWQSARDVKAALGLSVQLPTTSLPARRASPLPWIAAAAFAIAAAVALWSPWRQPPEDDRAMQFQIGAQPGADFVLGSGGGSAISPAGRLMAFVATSGGIPKLWVQPLDSTTARELPGTEGAQYPFWSPDDRSLGFFALGKLRRVDLAGGPVVTLADAPATRGGAWSESGTILFAPSTIGELYQLSAAGGAAPVPVTKVDAKHKDVSHRWPQFLPGGRRFLYLAQNSDAKLSGVNLSSLDRPDEQTRLVSTSYGASYTPPHGGHPGFLVWLRQTALTAQAFDPASGRLSGNPMPVPGADAVSSVSGNSFSGFSIAKDGTLLFRSGQGLSQLTWFNREGKVVGTVGEPVQYAGLSIAPDGKQVAVSIADANGARDAWVIDFARGVKTRVSSAGRGLTMIWSPDSTRLVFYPIAGTTLFERSANGASEEKTILQSTAPVYADDWSPDGRFLMYEASSAGRFELWYFPMDWPGPGDPKPVPYLRSSANYMNGQFSPDGKWVAYTSDESGPQQVYVQSFQEPGSRWQVSSGGGAFPHWRRDGKELFYRALDGRVMAASVTKTSRGLEFATPAALFRIVEPVGPHICPFDIAADGQRILALAPVSGHTEPLTILLNWQSKLRAQ